MTAWLQRFVNLSLAARFTLALALANLPLWLLGQIFFMSRAFVNVDTVIAICVMPFSAVAGTLLLALAWAADLVLSQSLTFHFRTPLDFIYSFKFASALDATHYANPFTATLCLPFLFSVGVLLRTTRRERFLWQPAVLITALFVLADAMNGSSMLSYRGTWQLPFNLAGSPVATLGKLAANDAPNSPLRTVPVSETVQGLVDIPAWAEDHPDRSVLFVIVESMGSPLDDGLRKWLDRQLIDDALRAKYEVRRAEVPFLGATTSGELRSLCGLVGSYRNMDAATGADCLPARLVRLGWSTVGMHGFSRQMFDRQVWWPMMGIQSTHFIDSPTFGDSRCGAAFRGGCDTDLINSGIAALRPGKRFVYLLTLNTHLPVDHTQIPGEMTNTCRAWNTQSDVCGLAANLGNVLRALRASLDSIGHLPLVVVVGDHAPPFAARSSRDSFNNHTVPTFILFPRD
jgi:hypothetical protein